MPIHQENNEKELLELISMGSEQSFAELVRLYSSRLYTYMYRITGDNFESEELVQDIFIQLWQTRETLTSIKNLQAYLYTLSKNRAINALKKVIRTRKEADLWQQHALLQTEDDTLQQKGNLLDQAIDALPPQQQKIWRMSRMHHMRYAAIANELGISKDAVNKALQAASKNITIYVKKHLDSFLVYLLITFLKK